MRYHIYRLAMGGGNLPPPMLLLPARLVPAYPALMVISPIRRGRLPRLALCRRGFFLAEVVAFHAASLFFLPFAGHANGCESFARGRNA